jgi:hypothetical protein
VSGKKDEGKVTDERKTERKRNGGERISQSERKESNDDKREAMRTVDWMMGWPEAAKIR